MAEDSGLRDVEHSSAKFHRVPDVTKDSGYWLVWTCYKLMASKMRTTVSDRQGVDLGPADNSKINTSIIQDKHRYFRYFRFFRDELQMEDRRLWKNVLPKARLIAKGFSQKEGVDFKETFSAPSQASSTRF